MSEKVLDKINNIVKNVVKGMHLDNIILKKVEINKLSENTGQIIYDYENLYQKELPPVWSSLSNVKDYLVLKLNQLLVLDKLFINDNFSEHILFSAWRRKGPNRSPTSTIGATSRYFKILSISILTTDKPFINISKFIFDYKTMIRNSYLDTISNDIKMLIMLYFTVSETIIFGSGNQRLPPSYQRSRRLSENNIHKNKFVTDFIFNNKLSKEYNIKIKF